MALFAQAPKVSTVIGKAEKSLEQPSDSYELIPNKNISSYETPPTTTRASSIGSALSRLLKRGTSREPDKARSTSLDSPLSPQDKSPKKPILKPSSSRIRANSRNSNLESHTRTTSNYPNAKGSTVDG